MLVVFERKFWSECEYSEWDAKKYDCRLSIQQIFFLASHALQVCEARARLFTLSTLSARSAFASEQ